MKPKPRKNVTRLFSQVYALTNGRLDMGSEGEIKYRFKRRSLWSLYRLMNLYIMRISYFRCVHTKRETYCCL